MNRATPIAAILMVAMIWRTPFSPDVRLNFQYAITWASLAAFSYYLCRVNLWAAFFLILASVSAWYPINTYESEKAHQMVVYGILFYLACVHYLNIGNIESILNVFCVIALANVAMLFMQSVFNYDPIHLPMPSRFESVAIDPAPNVGLMDCFNSASALLAFCLPAFLRKKWCWFIPAVIFGFIASHTFAGPLSAGACLIVFAVLMTRRWWAGLAMTAIAAVLLLGYVQFVDRPDTMWRLKTWKYALFNLFPQHWIMGSGIGHWKLIFARPDVIEKTLGLKGFVNYQTMAQAHNEFLQGLFEMGIGFGIVVIGYLLNIFCRAKRRIANNQNLCISIVALVSVIVNSSVFFPFHIGLLAMIAILWLSILEVSLREII